MRKNGLFFTSLLTLLTSSFFILAAVALTIPESPPATISTPTLAPISSEVTPSISSEAPATPSGEAIRPIIPGGTPESSSGSISAGALPAASPEAGTLISGEAVKPISLEATSALSGEAARTATPESTATPEGIGLTPKPPEEGSTYKDVPWGCDFNQFKQIKGYTGSLGPASAGFINSASDNDIALLLNVPVSPPSSKKEQRVMFEYVPQRFSCAYFAPDDVYYIFCGGKFSMVFSYLLAGNFDLYRDNFYKKYKHSGLVTKQYFPSAKRKYRIDALQFERGKTIAFLIKSQETVKNNTSLTAKMVLVANDFYGSIQQEIKNNVSAANQSKNLKLENDLKKIE